MTAGVDSHAAKTERQTQLIVPRLEQTDLNPEAGWDDGVFRYHHDAVPDEVIISIQVRRFTFWRNHNAVADARVFLMRAFLSMIARSITQLRPMPMGGCDESVCPNSK